MASTQKGELRVLEQVIQRSDYIFIKMKPMTEKPKLYTHSASRYFCLVVSFWKFTTTLVYLKTYGDLAANDRSLVLTTNLIKYFL